MKTDKTDNPNATVKPYDKQSRGDIVIAFTSPIWANELKQFCNNTSGHNPSSADNRGCQVWHPNWVRLAPIGTNLGLFKLVSVHFGSPN